MAKNKIEVSLEQEMRSAGEALKRVTSAAFAGSPGVAPTIKGKRKSAQFSFKLRASNDKRSLQSIARRNILTKVFGDRAAEVEKVIKRAMDAVIAGLVGAGNSNVRVFNRSLGSAKSQRDIDQEPFAKFIMSKAGAGEIGLPDPKESIRNLKAALLQAITVDVVVHGSGPQIKFTFDQRRLLKLTPHPNRFENGTKGPFFSWLSLVTGPDFVSGGTPGFSMVRASEIKESLRRVSPSSKSPKKINLRRANIAENLLRSSRTRGNAGEFAAIMLSNRSKRGGKSPAEAFGGSGSNYAPNSRFNGFWDEWWMRTKLELGVWSRRVMSATARSLMRG